MATSWSSRGDEGQQLRHARERMVEDQIAGRGVCDERVLAALGAVPRHLFVAPELEDAAYRDSALPIGHGQTISQPYIVALMTEALELTPSGRVLEVGTGSGYAAAVLSRIAHEVYTVERLEPLVVSASARCRRLGYDNIHFRKGDGTLGWAEHAPFDAISVTAGGPDVPRQLSEQLAIGGRLVMPVSARNPWSQTLLRMTRCDATTFEFEDLGEVRFVPLVGAVGWHEGAHAEVPAETP